MFNVKATYNNETRKFTLKEDSFPSYSSICDQLYRVFPIRGSYYLSKILFSPSEGARVIVGREVHNETHYNDLINPFSGRLWPNGLLRFTVVDEIPHKRPGSSTTLLDRLDYSPSPELSSSGTLSRSFLRQPHPTSMNVMDAGSGQTTSQASNRYSMLSQSTQQSCCSVAEGKSEMKELMTSFLHDFGNIMSSTFGEESSVLPSASPTPATGAGPDSAAVPAGEHRDASSAADMNIPGAFFQPIPSPASVGKLVYCNFCGETICGLYHKCDICIGYDLCRECVEERGAKDAHRVVFAQRQGDVGHTFSTFPKSDDSSLALHLPQTATSADAVSSDRISPDAPPLIHVGVVCDSCQETVIGHRHKCLDCPDFDLCDDCFPNASSEHGPHEFVTIQEPGRVIVHRVYSGDEGRPQARPIGQRHQSFFRRPETGSDAAGPLSVVHQASCDLCDSRIRGTRYKCLTCPDFDTCASCHRIVPMQHPGHTFVKLEDVQDLSPCDPSTYKRHNARCDECSKPIRGVRYKCMHPECPDYDLCAKCEAMPIEVHPATHPMLKMRSPDTVIPTVYRVGGASLITPSTQPHHSTDIAVATDPLPEKVDASVHAELRAETTEAAVSTSSATIRNLPAECSVDLPVLPTPPLFTPFTSLRDSLPVVHCVNQPSERSEEVTDVKVQGSPNAPLISTFLEEVSRRRSGILRAAFVSDVNIEDGQIFPAGAEFVKSWRIQNDGETVWPESTRVVFVAGDRMPAFDGAPLSYHVGRVEPGVTVDINAADMKAPDVPGKYVGYWRLSDGMKLFGQSVWCDIMVPVQDRPLRLHESLTASEVIMPEPFHISGPVGHPSPADTPELILSGMSPATPTMSGGIPSSDYDSSDSLLDDFGSTSDDEFWEASREQMGRLGGSGDVEYVVLYDNESTDEESR
ncbi:hypothetical protein M0805_003775 [Coniferiporia weirii]|nr:hypothetical protein M0805_003775 [Coniferiporia weirii]